MGACVATSKLTVADVITATDTEEDYARIIGIVAYGYCIEVGYYDIPQDVFNILVMFCKDLWQDKWDENMKGEYMQIISNTIWNTADDFQNAYLCQEACSGIHIWKIQINRMANQGLHVFGVWKMKYGQPIWNNGYGYVLSCAKRTDCAHPYFLGRTYGISCSIHDIIEMILDFNSSSLSYRVNGIDQGKAFEFIEKTTYRAAITLSEYGDSIALISYMRI